MITRRDLDEAIEELEAKNPSMEGCIRLAALYTVRAHLFEGGDSYGAPAPTETVIGEHGDSEFLQMIAHKDAAHVWSVMAEAMESLKLMEPRFYAGILRKLNQ